MAAPRDLYPRATFTTSIVFKLPLRNNINIQLLIYTRTRHDHRHADSQNQITVNFVPIAVPGRKLHIIIEHDIIERKRTDFPTRRSSRSSHSLPARIERQMRMETIPNHATCGMFGVMAMVQRRDRAALQPTFSLRQQL